MDLPIVMTTMETITMMAKATMMTITKAEESAEAKKPATIRILTKYSTNTTQQVVLVFYIQSFFSFLNF